MKRVQQKYVGKNLSSSDLAEQPTQLGTSIHATPLQNTLQQ